MAYNGENSAPRPSGLKPPSRIPAAMGLLEMSSSESNARAMMPPPSGSLKHKGSALREPAAKRKTLAERAGESHRSHAAAPRPAVNGAIRASANAAMRNISSASSITSRTSSRQLSAASRPPSAASYQRPQSVLAHSRSKSALPSMRPTLNDPEDSDSSGEHSQLPTKRKGTHSASPSSRSKNTKKASSPSLRTMNTPFITPRRQRKRQGQFVTTRTPRARTVDPQPIPSRIITEDAPTSPSPSRNLSLASAFKTLRLSSNIHQAEEDKIPPSQQDEPLCPKTPSHIPKPILKTIPKTPHHAAGLHANLVPVVTPSKSTVCRTIPERSNFLTRDSNMLAPAWDTKGRLEDMEVLYSQLKSQLDSASKENHGMEDTIEIYKTRINELEAIRLQLVTQNQTLSTDLHDVKLQLSSANTRLDDSTRSHNITVDDMKRSHRNEMEDARDSHRKELEQLTRDTRDQVERMRKEHKDEVDSLNRSRKEELQERERDLRSELEEERSRRAREIQELTTQFALQRQNTDIDISNKDREMQSLRSQLSETQAKLESSTALVNNMNDKLAESAANAMTLDTSMRAMKAKIDFLESDNQAQSTAFQEIHQKMQDAVDHAAAAQEKLRQEETLRRKLHNQVQELKGNIRVFCRVRPTLGDEEDQRAEIAFPDAETDSKEVAVQGPEQKSAMGTVSRPVTGFSFDRVFSPSSQNAEIFDEISQLVQSALDGYNVCIFCYGQTGSGKTYTMSSVDGMIPRAVTQIYESAKELEDKGWKYSMEGSFVEVYNETINDLLGKAEDWEKKKHEIRQDTVRCKTTVTDVEVVDLDSPDRVNSILDQATRNRRVAATAANSRSSRSHSVFILRLTGENSITGERSEGTLNLVDLAGSERLGHSQATGDRLRETQNINKSLSCLGDVIGALGQGKDGKHVPYRNSKLTYLLQYSLGGNSKTLMFVMISPLQAHLSETLTSLKFATKVHNTHIGTAKKQTKVKD